MTQPEGATMLTTPHRSTLSRAGIVVGGLVSVAIASTLPISSAHAADAPAALRLTSYSSYGTAGLNLTSTVTVSATTGPLSDVYLTFSSTPETGLTNPTQGYLANPMCRQDGGPGSDIVCGPYFVEAGRGVPVYYNPGIPADHLIAHGGAPVRVTATLSSPSHDLSEVTPLEITTPVRSALSFTTAVRRDPASVTTPGSTLLSLRIANGGYSDVEQVTGLLTVPTGLTVRSLPAGCSFAGEPGPAGRPVQCTIPYFRWGTLVSFDIPVLVDAGLDVGSLTVPDPQWQISSPHEPSGAPSTWVARQVGSPYALTVTGEGEAVGVNMALTLEPPNSGPFEPGSLADVTFSASNLHETQTASQVTVVFEATALAADLTAGHPGCAATGTRVECLLGEFGPGLTVTGTLTVRHGENLGPGDVTINGTIRALETELDQSNTGAVSTVEFRPVTSAPDPTGSATPAPDATSIDGTGPTMPARSASSLLAGPVAPAAASVIPAGNLPQTGASAAATAWLAFGIVTVGALSALAARRRSA